MEASIERASQRGNMRFVGNSDLDGHGDGMHVNLRGSIAYVGHMGESRVGTSIVDVSDPRAPRVVRQLETPPGTHSHKVQVVDDLLLVNYERNAREDTADGWQGGLKVFDIADPTDPKEIGFFRTTAGAGVHRMTCWETPYVYMSASDEGYSDQFLMIVDISDPTTPVEAGRWWYPGMHLAGGEAPTWGPEKRRVAFHHAVVQAGRAYCGFWDAGAVVLDVSDPAHPTVLGEIDLASDGGRATHSVVPILDTGLIVETDEETVNGCAEGQKHVRVLDGSDLSDLRILSRFPVPEGDFCVEGARFGPHNIHEMRPGSFQSDSLVFLTYFSAGLRVVDISTPSAPKEVAWFVPPAPDGQPAIQFNDVHVAADGLVYVTDRYHGGLYILEME